MAGGIYDVITCAKIEVKIYTSYDFIGGRIFDFPIGGNDQSYKP